VRDITLQVNGDTTFEPDESATLSLTPNMPDVTVAGTTCTQTIVNDD